MATAAPPVPLAAAPSAADTREAADFYLNNLPTTILAAASLAAHSDVVMVFNFAASSTSANVRRALLVAGDAGWAIQEGVLSLSKTRAADLECVSAGFLCLMKTVAHELRTPVSPRGQKRSADFNDQLADLFAGSGGTGGAPGDNLPNVAGVGPATITGVIDNAAVDEAIQIEASGGLPPPVAGGATGTTHLSPRRPISFVASFPQEPRHPWVERPACRGGPFSWAPSRREGGRWSRIRHRPLRRSRLLLRLATRSDTCLDAFGFRLGRASAPYRCADARLRPDASGRTRSRALPLGDASLRA